MSESDARVPGEELDEEWAEMLGEVRQRPDPRMPSALLEERTVRELRRRGLLRRRRALSPAWLAGAVAASIALFATGVVVGQYLGTRTTAGVVAEMQNAQDAGSAAAQVQQAGTAYVHALEALVSAARISGQDPTQAREVALTALHEAANEVVRLAPNDPVVAKILQGIEQEKKQSQLRTGRQTDRQIVWF